MESKQPQITCDEPAVNISGKLSLLQQVFTHYIIHIYIIYYIYIYIYSCLHLHNVHIAASKYSLRERARLNNSRCGVCVCPLNSRHRSLKPLVFLWSWAPPFIIFFFFFCYEAVTQHALQKVLSKRLGAGAEFVKKAELSGQTHVTHSHQTRTVQQDQIAKSLYPHAQKSPYPSPNVKIPSGEEPSLSLFERMCHVVTLSLLFFVQCCSKSHFCTPPILGICPQRGGEG